MTAKILLFIPTYLYYHPHNTPARKWYTNRMKAKNYQDTIGASRYLDFLESPNGQIQKSILTAAILPYLANNKHQTILDLACGPGWLTKALSQNYPATEGCDGSDELVSYAKKHFPGIPFKTADAIKPLPYPDEFFDCIICNMALPDMENLDAVFNNIFLKLKETAHAIITIPNPYYTFLLNQQVKTHPVKHKIEREFRSGEKISSFVYSLPDYLSAARKAGLQLITFEELRSSQDSTEFDLHYQMHRFPLILLFEFIRPTFR